MRIISFFINLSKVTEASYAFIIFVEIQRKPVKVKIFVIYNIRKFTLTEEKTALTSLEREFIITGGFILAEFTLTGFHCITSFTNLA